MEDTLTERHILIVESNAQQAETIQQTLATCSRQQSLVIQTTMLQSGVEAIAHLNQVKTQAVVRPDLILLDLNLQNQTGSELLSTIKMDGELRRIPVIVLAASADEADIFKSYELQGNCYITKSGDAQQLVQTIERIEAFWLGIVTLPLR
jgi:two-component system, chemotaxis family, response regulator Rcp1